MFNTKNKHDYLTRPHIDDVWENFDYIALMVGAGDDTAMLIAECYERGIRIDALVFCDTGSEFPHTYKFVEYLKKWCEEKKWSKVVTLRKFDKFKQPLSVIGLCQTYNTLPAAAFGAKSCSMRFKVETADVYFNNNYDCWQAWGVEGKGTKISTHTGKILRLVGLNADEERRVNGWKPQDKWVQSFPLFDWDIGEAESCAVERVGLYYPGKSSCTVCPHLTHGEIAMLRDKYPDKFQESLDIESAYIEHNRVDYDTILLNEHVTYEQVANMSKEQYAAFDRIHEGMSVDEFVENYNSEDVLMSLKFDGIISTDPESTTVGLGRRKTWEQKLAEYDANPGNYKRMTDTKPCECGR